MRRAVFTGLVASFLLTTPAQARVVPSLLAPQIRAINRAPHAPPVLLPWSMPLDVNRAFTSGGPAGASYSLSIAAAPHCGGIQARLKSARGDRAALISAAEGAIRAGPR